MSIRFFELFRLLSYKGWLFILKINGGQFVTAQEAFLRGSGGELICGFRVN